MVENLKNILRKLYRYGQKKIFFSKISCDVRTLLLVHYNDGSFNRYDVIIRLLAIEQIYGLNEYGFSLYEKMSLNLPSISLSTRVSNFIKLIQSYEENGYDKNSYILIDRKYDLVDGSHRIALALYHYCYEISCKKTFFNRYHIAFGEERLRRCDFTEEEIFFIKERFNQLYKQVLLPYKSMSSTT